MLEAGLVSESGPLSLSLTVLRGAGFEGGHLETRGLSGAGQVVPVPRHRHDVSLDLLRLELGLSARLSEAWAVRLRVPYDVKQRTASVVLIDPATDAEIDAMQRNLDLHHPTEALRGLSDPQLLLSHRGRGLWREEDSLFVSIGTSLPLGRIEEDPYVLGDAGLPHEHIQFGTGTFDPLLELHYSMPVADDLHLSLSSAGRFPVQENIKGYQAPVELSAELGLGVELDPRLSLHAGWSFLHQDFAHWRGVRDVNSGLVAHGVTAGLHYRLGSGVGVLASVRVPVSQRTLTSEGDTFELGTLFQVGVSFGF